MGPGLPGGLVAAALIGIPAYAIHAVGGTFVLARLLHAFAFTSNSGSHLVDARGAGKKFVLMRVSGALLTALSSLALGITLIVSILLN